MSPSHQAIQIVEFAVKLIVLFWIEANNGVGIGFEFDGKLADFSI